jgi:hypothetical protein
LDFMQCHAQPINVIKEQFWYKIMWLLMSKNFFDENEFLFLRRKNIEDDMKLFFTLVFYK